MSVKRIKRKSLIPGTPLENDRHEAFIHEYRTNGRNATMAYMTIYKSKYATAKTDGGRLLSYVHVKDRLSELDEHDVLERYRQNEELRSKYDAQLAKIAFHPVDEVRASESISAMRQLNENRGWYQQAAQDTKITVDVNYDKLKKENWIANQSKPRTPDRGSSS